MFATAARLADALITGPFKRAQLGLFHGQVKKSGNNVPHSKHKTRRTWTPNVQRKRLQLTSIGREVRVTLTTKALRSIKKAGTLDAYLLKTSPSLLGFEGMRLRSLVNEQHEVDQKAQEREEELRRLGNRLLARQEAEAAVRAAATRVRLAAEAKVAKAAKANRKAGTAVATKPKRAKRPEKVKA